MAEGEKHRGKGRRRASEMTKKYALFTNTDTHIHSASPRSTDTDTHIQRRTKNG